MKPTVITVPEHSILGSAGQGPSKFASWWVRPLWKRLDDEFDTIRHLVRRNADGQVETFWGLISDAHNYLAPWGAEGRYMAGCAAVAGVSPPKGFAIWHVPKQTCLVVTCTQDSYNDTYANIIAQLEGLNNYRMCGAMRECYPLGLAQGMLQLYFPIRTLTPEELAEQTAAEEEEELATEYTHLQEEEQDHMGETEDEEEQWATDAPPQEIPTQQADE